MESHFTLQHQNFGTLLSFLQIACNFTHFCDNTQLVNGHVLYKVARRGIFQKRFLYKYLVNPPPPQTKKKIMFTSHPCLSYSVGMKLIPQTSILNLRPKADMSNLLTRRNLHVCYVDPLCLRYDLQTPIISFISVNILTRTLPQIPEKYVF